MHQRKGLTSVIHGKYGHEETVATTSFCEEYICVKNMKEAEMVADYMLNGGNKEEFLKYFAKAVSKGFDPDTMLTKVGLANQTTMYKKETKAIGQLFQKTMMKKYGPADVDQHYMEFDTICDATQVRPTRWLRSNSIGSLRLGNCLSKCVSILRFALLETNDRNDKMLFRN
jgi:4-hydroxy-3-methylbut-2-en-1-yl diphosphate reductase